MNTILDNLDSRTSNSVPRETVDKVISYLIEAAKQIPVLASSEALDAEAVKQRISSV